MPEVTYRGQKIVEKKEGEAWQARIGDIGIRTSLHVNPENAIEEAKKYVDSGKWRG